MSVSALAPDADLHDYALRLGDDALVLGQRLAEWCGHAPTLEVDLSLANLGLDLIGQATLFLTVASDADAKGRDPDRLAFFRDALQYRNCLLVEQPNGDFAQTIARQFLASAFQLPFHEALAKSAEPRLAEIAARAAKEMRYHADLAADWVVRLGDGTEESGRRMTAGLAWCWRFVDELFDMDALETRLLTHGVSVDRTQVRPAFDARVAQVLGEARLQAPATVRPVRGGRRGHHSEHLGHLLAVMQHLPRSYPDAVW